LQEREPNHDSLEKYANVGRIFAQHEKMDSDAAREALLGIVQAWSGRLRMPPLSHYGVAEIDVNRIVTASRGNSMQTNPVLLTDEEIGGIIRRRL